MDKKVIDLSTLTGIADAIRTKEGSTDKITVSDFASRIEALPTGSSSGKCVKVYDSGDVTFDTDSYMQTFEHDLGVAPQFVRLWTDEENYTELNRACGHEIIFGIDGIPDLQLNTYSGTSVATKLSTVVISNGIDPTDSEITVRTNSSTRYFYKGVTMHYECFAGIEFEE